MPARHLLVQSTKNSRRQAPLRPKQAQKNPNLVSLDQIQERVLLELSAAFAQQLRAQRSDLKNLSFFCEESAKPRRMELAKLINRLSGNWKISENAKTTNFIIVDQSILKGREHKVPQTFVDIVNKLSRQAEEYVAKGQHLKHQSQSSIQESKGNTASEAPLHQTQTAYRTSFPQNLSSSRAPAARAQPEKAVPIAVLRSWLPEVDHVSRFGRQILANDLTQALRFLESQTAPFHTSRMKMLLLERDQKKPTAFSDDGAFFVISKLNIGGPDEKHSSVQQMIRDITNRQVFHEFDKLQNMPLTQGGGSSTGLSPAKSLMQVAMAQEKLQEAKYHKASPVGFLNRENDTERQAKMRLRQQYNTHKFDTKTPNGYCPCVSKTEKQFVTQNFDRIEKTRERETYKNLQKAIETNNDVQDWHNMTLLEPIPNEQHTYCQVCMETYEDYLDHIQNSATHKKRAKIQEGPFAEIDIIMEDLNKKEKWINSWKAEPIVEYPMASLNGFSQYSQLHSQNFMNEGHQQFSGTPRYSSISKRKRTQKPPTPFKARPLSRISAQQQQQLQQSPPGQTTDQNGGTRIDSSVLQPSESAAVLVDCQGRSVSQSAAWPKASEVAASKVDSYVSPAKDSCGEDKPLTPSCASLSRRGQLRSNLGRLVTPAGQPSVDDGTSGAAASSQAKSQVDEQDEESEDEQESSDYDQHQEPSSYSDNVDSQMDLYRESLHKTDFHSVKPPIENQTHFQKQIENAHSDQQAEQPEEEEVENQESSESFHESREESQSEDEYNNQAPLGNQIARKDRENKGLPITTPEKNSTPPMEVDPSYMSENSEAQFFEIVKKQPTEELRTPEKQSSPVNKVLYFAVKPADEQRSQKENGLATVEALESHLKNSPHLPPLSYQGADWGDKKSGMTLKLFNQASTPQMRAPQPSPDDAITGSAAAQPMATTFMPLMQTFEQVQVEELKSEHAFGHVVEETEKLKEESQSWKAEDLIEFINDDESDHQNVFTEEVTNDRRVLDHHQISVDLTPCSEHHNPDELLDNDNQMTRGFQQMSDVLSAKDGKKSVVSQLTSNDKYSVADRRSSVTSEKNETGKFGTIGSAVSAFQENLPNYDIKLEREASREPANDGTFGNVSFGENDKADETCGRAALETILKQQKQQQLDDYDLLFQHQQVTKAAQEKSSQQIEANQKQLAPAQKLTLKPNREEQILLLEQKQQRRPQYQGSMFTSQPQMQSQQTFDAGEFSSSQNLIAQPGTVQFSSFDTQKSVQATQQQAHPSAFAYKQSLSSQSRPPYAGTGTLHIECTTRMIYNAPGNELPVQSHYGGTSGEQKLAQHRSQPQPMNANKGLRGAKPPQPQASNEPYRKKMYKPQRRFLQGSTHLKMSALQKRPTVATPASQPHSQLSRQTSGANIQKKRTHAQAFPDELAREGRPSKLIKRLVNIDTPMTHNPKSVLKRAQQMSLLGDRQLRQAQPQLLQPSEQPSVDILFNNTTPKLQKAEQH